MVVYYSWLIKEDRMDVKGCNQCDFYELIMRKLSNFTTNFQQISAIYLKQFFSSWKSLKN